MAYFAQVVDGMVTQVVAVPDESADEGEAYMRSLGLPGRWIQTSYSTRHGDRSDGGQPLRLNYAGAGFTYDEELDGFLEPQPFPSWQLEATSGAWSAPVPYPAGKEGRWEWSEELGGWAKVIPPSQPFDGPAAFMFFVADDGEAYARVVPDVLEEQPQTQGSAASTAVASGALDPLDTQSGALSAGAVVAGWVAVSAAAALAGHAMISNSAADAQDLDALADDAPTYDPHSSAATDASWSQDAD